MKNVPAKGNVKDGMKFKRQFSPTICVSSWEPIDSTF